jgi:hypothetical protein
MTPPLRSSACVAIILAGGCSMLSATQARAEVFVDFGINYSRIEADIPLLPAAVSTTESGLHVGAGLRRELTQGSIGARVEIDDIGGDLLLAVRALDYRRHVSERFALTAFLGAAQLDLATPAQGYYLGGGVEIKDLWPKWTLAIDARLGDKLARDNLLPSDPQGTAQNDSFFDLTGLSLYLSRRF